VVEHRRPSAAAGRERHLPGVADEADADALQVGLFAREELEVGRPLD
jgi:hypothetical protein